MQAGHDERRVWFGADLRLCGTFFRLATAVFIVRTLRNSSAKVRSLLESIFKSERAKRKEVEELAARLAEVEAIRVRRLSDSERHATELPAIRRLREEVSSLQRDSNAKDEQISALESRILTSEEQRRAAFDAARSIQRDMIRVEETARRNCQEQAEKIRTLEGQLSTVLGSVSSLSIVGEEASALRLEVKRLRGEAESRARELETAELRSVQEREGLAQRLAALEGDLKVAQDDRTRLQMRVDSLVAEVSRLGENAGSAARDASDLREELKGARKDAQNKEQTILRLGEQLLEADKVRKDLVIQKKRAAREALEAEEASLRQLRELEAQVRQLESGVRERDDKLKSAELANRQRRGAQDARSRRESQPLPEKSQIVYVNADSELFHTRRHCQFLERTLGRMRYDNIYHAKSEGRQICSACREHGER